jgi:hypothetical protein
MTKFNSGKVSLLALTTVFAVSAFLLGKTVTSTFALAPYKVICHHTPGNEVTHEFANEQAYDGHLGTPHNAETYDTDGACTGTPTPSASPEGTPTPEASATPEPSATPSCEERENCPTATPTPTSTPKGDDPLTPAGPPNAPPYTPSGQVLGASTMAATGSFAENLYLAIMALGGTLSAFGIKNVKKAFQKAK